MAGQHDEWLLVRRQAVARGILTREEARSWARRLRALPAGEATPGLLVEGGS